MHRSDDAGRSWVEITDGLPTEFGFAAAAHPHDRDTFYVIPLDPGHGRTMPDGKAAVWRTRDGGESWQRLDNGLPQSDAYLGVLRAAPTADEAIDELDGRWPGLRDRLCEPGPALRRHIHVYVDRERAALDTPIEGRSHVNVIAAISGG